VFLLHAAESESLHLLHDLTESSEFEGFRNPRVDPVQSASSAPSEPEPWLRNRLRAKLPFWKQFCTSLMVFNIISTGYQLPWSNGPPPGPFYQKNHPSAFEHPDFVSQAVQTLVATGAAMPVSFRPFIVSPLGVVPKGLDKLRLILDLRYLNSFLHVQSFKYESIREVEHLAKLRDMLFTVDLKSGYHHIDIDPENWRYLGFEWMGQFYVFCQLPFGLATACFVFTKVLKQLVQFWRKQGIRLIPYIDDFLFICSSSDEFAAVQAKVLGDFAKAGFVLSVEKCQLRPSHVVQFLGFVIDTLHGVYRLTAVRKAKLLDAISSCLSSPARVPAKLVARTTGLITSISLVTGSLSGLFSRFLHRALNLRASWHASVSLDESACDELRFWQQSLERFTAREIWRFPSLLRVLHYDAGADGWGGHIVIDGQEHRAHGYWAAHERHGVRSSTWRELEGLFRLLASLEHFLSGFTVVARGDALNVFFLLYRGGSKAEHLQDICLWLFWFCHERHIELVPEWIPRKHNQLADYLFKVHEVDDFGLQPAMFDFVLSEFGPLDVDRLPRRTTRCSQYFSRSSSVRGPLG
jgi:hypothetical protein